jgi:hypothetical protein
MADYYPLISRAVAGLEKNNGENRRALYDARGVIGAVARVTPALNESDITRSGSRRGIDPRWRPSGAAVSSRRASRRRLRSALAAVAGPRAEPASGKTRPPPAAAPPVNRRRPAGGGLSAQMRRGAGATDAPIRVHLRPTLPSEPAPSGLRSSRAIRCAGPPVSAARCPMPASRISATSSRRRTSSALRRRGRKSPRATPMPGAAPAPISTGRARLRPRTDRAEPRMSAAGRRSACSSAGRGAAARGFPSRC